MYIKLNIYHGIRKVTIISFWTHRSGWCNLIATASAYFDELQRGCLLLTLKAIFRSTECSVSNKCFAIELFDIPSSYCSNHLGECSFMRVDTILTLRLLLLFNDYPNCLTMHWLTWLFLIRIAMDQDNHSAFLLFSPLHHGSVVTLILI